MRNITKGLLIAMVAHFCVSAYAHDIELSAPANSDDGSYVLRVDAEQTAFQLEQEGKQLEIYRNKDGGEYKRILVGPRFSALSELVREDGTYGYKARWVSLVSKQPVADFSNVVFVEVTTAVPRMVAPRSDKLVSNFSQLNPSLN
ncbi:hypothetical protein SAMN02745866_01549 [Alteromonadaceae bacterium Bs31]|nr:hypothetical protein SAMN02745866_01549 [Alteromonadaceae bacterium Bs31]